MKRLFSLWTLLHIMFFVSSQTIIKMEKTGGVYKIPCKVNGLALKFIFDTGASDVSLSLTEALFMLKNGYLNTNDLTGTERYRIANGDIQEGTTVVLRTLEVGGMNLYNVKASISHTSEAPLLFGQTAMKRFGKFSIDYSTNTLMLGGNTTHEVDQTQKKETLVNSSDTDWTPFDYLHTNESTITNYLQTKDGVSEISSRFVSDSKMKVLSWQEESIGYKMAVYFDAAGTSVMTVYFCLTQESMDALEELLSRLFTKVSSSEWRGKNGVGRSIKIVYYENEGVHGFKILEP